jgi:AcrR family transcriptional regulator
MARLTNLTDRGLETERLLRDILVNLILENGYDRISIKDITEKAGIDRTTFYLHFKDKDDLYSRCRRSVIDELLELREGRSGPWPGVLVTFEHMARNSELWLALFMTEGIASPEDGLRDYIVRSMTPILEAQLGEEGIDPGLVVPLAHYLNGALRGLARWWLEAGRPIGADEIGRLFLELAARGITSLRMT